MKTAIAGFQFNRHLIFQRSRKRLLLNLSLTFNVEQSPLVAARNKPQTSVFDRRVVQRRPATHEAVRYIRSPRVGILVIILARPVRGRFHEQLIAEQLYIGTE